MIEVSDHAGGRVRALREVFGYTQMQLAELTGISQGQLSKIERGEISISSGQLEVLTSVTGAPMSFMTADPVEITEGSLRFRKTTRTAKRSQTKQLAQLVVEAYRVCTDVATRQGLRPPELPQAEAEEPSPEDLEEAAMATRQALGLPANGPVSHVTRACERAGIFVVPLRLPNAQPDAKVIGHDGVSTRRAFFDPALIGYLPDAPGDRLRHTLAHELGHLVLHQPASRRLPSREVEQQAHHFAGAFLLPRDSALEAFSAAQPLTLEPLKYMKAGWGMAIQALITRAWQVGMLSDDHRRSLYMQLSSRGWRKNEPVTVHPEHPLLLRKVLETRYGSPIDWSAVGDELGIPGELLKPLAPDPPA